MLLSCESHTFCWPQAHPCWGQQGWVDLQEVRTWLNVPGQPWAGVVEGLPGESNTRLHSIFPCPGSAAKDRALFPSLSPFPLLAPNAAPPRCQVSTLLPRTFTQQWHQTPRLGGDKSPHRACNTAQQWGKSPEITQLPAMPRAG